MFLETVINPIKERMRAARHSSGHFLQSGYKAARDACVQSDFFKNRYRKQSGSANDNRLNRLDNSGFGGTVIELNGDQCQVVSTNNIGEDGSTPELNSEHRRALIEYSAGQLQDAVDKESADCQTELERRIAEKWTVFNRLLS